MHSEPDWSYHFVINRHFAFLNQYALSVLLQDSIVRSSTLSERVRSIIIIKYIFTYLITLWGLKAKHDKEKIRQTTV